MLRRVLTVLWAAALLLSFRETQAAPRRAADPARGQRLYQRFCSTCHGARGDGRGPSARRLGAPWPRDFRRGQYKFRSTRMGDLPTNGDLMRTVWRGVPGTAMPAWRNVLDVDQIADVVSYVKLFSPRFRQDEQAGEAPERVAIPKAARDPSTSSMERGRSVFLLMKCWSCHGVDGQGNGPDSSKLRDALGRRITPRDFTSGLFKGGSSPRAIYRTLATGLDGTPMAPVFDEPRAMLGPLVFQRAAYRTELGKIEASLTAEDRRALAAFERSLPTEQAMAKLDEEQLERLLQGWRWDLVFYLRSLSQERSIWRSFLGI